MPDTPHREKFDSISYGSGIRKLLFVLLCVAALISAVQGFRNALQNSQDAQWRAARILVHDGEDLYEEYLKNPAKVSVTPVYPHFFYLIGAPFALLDTETAKIAWAAANLAFVVACFLLLRNRFDGGTLVTVFLVFMCSTPVRNSIGNGQQSLLCLFLYVLAVRLADQSAILSSSLVAGIGAFKYSFGAPLLFAFDFNRWRNAFFYLVPAALGVIFWTLYFHRGIIETAFLPLRILSEANYFIGTADLQSELRVMGLSSNIATGISALLLIGAVCLQKLFMPIDDTFDRFSIYSLLSILLLYHWGYDHVFLLGCLLVAIRSRSLRVRLATFAIVTYFWFVLKAISLVGDWAPPIIVNNILLWILFGVLIFEIGYGRSKGQTILGSQAAWSVPKTIADSRAR